MVPASARPGARPRHTPGQGMSELVREVVRIGLPNQTGRLPMRGINQATDQGRFERPLQVPAVDGRGRQRPAGGVDQVVGQLVGKLARLLQPAHGAGGAQLADGPSRHHCRQRGFDGAAAAHLFERLANVAFVVAVDGVFEEVAGGQEPPRIIFHPATGVNADTVTQAQAALRKRILRAFVGRGLLESFEAKEMLGYKHSGF